MSKDPATAEFDAIVKRLEEYVSNISENVPENPQHKLQEINFFLENLKQDEKSKAENEEQNKKQKQTLKLPPKLEELEEKLIKFGLKTNKKSKSSKVTELRSLAEELAGQYNLIYSTALKNKDVLLAWFELNWDIIEDHIQETLQKINKKDKP